MTRLTMATRTVNSHLLAVAVLFLGMAMAQGSFLNQFTDRDCRRQPRQPQLGTPDGECNTIATSNTTSVSVGPLGRGCAISVYTDNFCSLDATAVYEGDCTSIGTFWRSFSVDGCLPELTTPRHPALHQHPPPPHQYWHRHRHRHRRTLQPHRRCLRIGPPRQEAPVPPDERAEEEPKKGFFWPFGHRRRGTYPDFPPPPAELADAPSRHGAPQLAELAGAEYRELGIASPAEEVKFSFASPVYEAAAAPLPAPTEGSLIDISPMRDSDAVMMSPPGDMERYPEK
ncbi:hypothetical protein DRE_01745 [Drechslerella stenobrocha 248]|uniref:Uncharacterized protein n=1 Tax=Drechslerella stenobrocha 248 TaxID=1043628 RepID=W7I8A9_9PEZI|nr:hypothetical protein DRE_01745 [Drechslerella stenobrocha 248]